MSIDKSGMISATQSNIDSIDTNRKTCDLVALSAATNRLTTDRKSYVTLACNLPDLNLGTTPEGTMFYAQELGIPVVATGKAWTGLDGRTYRKDVPDTTMFGWGYQARGNAGINTTINRSSPVQEASSSINWCTSYKAHDGGGDHSVMLKKDGTLWSSGIGISGRLGNGSTLCRSSPVQEFCSSTNWCGVAAGDCQSFGVKTDGTLWGWGRDQCGQLGLNSVSALGYCSPLQEITSSTNWCYITSGYANTTAIKNDGTLWGWGFGVFCGIGDGSATNRSSPVQEALSSTNWSSASYGSASVTALKTDGTLWAWGFNQCGELGINSLIRPYCPAQEITSSSNWCFTEGGNSSSIGIKTDGTLWLWGYNFYGQLATNSSINYSSPVQEITSSTDWCLSKGSDRNVNFGVKTNGTLWGWGQNDQGQIGDGSVIFRSSPVQEVTSSTDWSVVNAGNCHTQGIKNIL